MGSTGVIHQAKIFHPITNGKRHYGPRQTQAQCARHKPQQPAQSLVCHHRNLSLSNTDST
jgi:hypothetical protein